MTAPLSSLVWSALLVRTVTGCSGEPVCTVHGKGYEMLFRTNCNAAADIELTLSLEDRKALNGTGMWPPTRRKIRWGIRTCSLLYTFKFRFGSQSDGTPWKGKY